MSEELNLVGNSFEADRSPVEPYRGNEIFLKGGEFNIKPSNWKPTEVTLKPMLFAWDRYYPQGGWNDFVGFFDTIQKAKDRLTEMEPYFDDKDFESHIVVDGKIVCKGYIVNEKWAFVEQKEDE